MCIRASQGPRCLQGPQEILERRAGRGPPGTRRGRGDQGRPGPGVRGVLRPFGNGRTRTVRGVGADTVTVTPRRARCADCQVTQILLPTELLVRRGDSTAAIGNALVAKACGAGFRSIAARFGRPESTVRRWLRAVREPHAQWLYRRGVEGAVLVDLALLDWPAPQQTTLG